ncbi:cytokine inducing-glycoprotein [Gigaspora margarita]|uniref:Cytokine inducing-glycoprotein n=1 Tax=Gigaspora margarita TaxID=4874 RepID=A0A8H4EP35_GIGMA|nr:cytokine inducing-glycoprotein [Gigaspora margarita]
MKFGVFCIFSLLVPLFNTINAHYELQAPPSRGFEDSLEPNPPCGGFNIVNSSLITNFPISQGIATANFFDGDGTLYFYFAPNINSTFISVSDAQKLVNPDIGQQVHVSVNLSKANAVVGSQGILQSVFNLSTGNGAWYQCADIKVTGDTRSSANNTQSSANNTQSSANNTLSNANNAQSSANIINALPNINVFVLLIWLFTYFVFLNRI